MSRRPIHVRSTRDLRLTPAQVGEAMLQLENWTDFRGYGPLPGIREARFRVRTPEVVGTEIAVTNTDGSGHVEVITEWLGTGAIAMRFGEFTPPLSRFATHFIEHWAFEPLLTGSRVVRRFELHPRTWFGGLLLRFIAPLMRRAVDRHLADMDSAS